MIYRFGHRARSRVQVGLPENHMALSKMCYTSKASAPFRQLHCYLHLRFELLHEHTDRKVNANANANTQQTQMYTKKYYRNTTVQQ